MFKMAKASHTEFPENRIFKQNYGKDKKEKVHKIVKEMCDFVKDYAVQDMRTDLQDMNKYDFLLEVLPDFTTRASTLLPSLPMSSGSCWPALPLTAPPRF